VEHFIELVPLRKAETLTDCMKKKGLVIGNMFGMGFDGAATFSGRHNRVQALINKNSPHSIFVHCHCHLLKLACVQAANNTTQGIKHVYTILTTLFIIHPNELNVLKKSSKYWSLK